MLREQPIRVGTIKIVGIDGGKRRADGIGGGQNRVRGSPRFGTIRWNFKIRRHLAEFLEYIFYGDSLFKMRADRFLELRFDVFPNHEHESAKARPHRVVNRIINDRLAVRSDLINLFEAAITAAHSGSQHK